MNRYALKAAGQADIISEAIKMLQHYRLPGLLAVREHIRPGRPLRFTGPFQDGST